MRELRGWRYDDGGAVLAGMLMVLKNYLEENPYPSRDDARRSILGNLSRCTGYQHIVDAAMDAAARMDAATPANRRRIISAPTRIFVVAPGTPLRPLRLGPCSAWA